MLNVKQGSCEYQLLVFGLTQPGIESELTVSVADALSTRPLIGYIRKFFLFLWSETSPRLLFHDEFKVSQNLQRNKKLSAIF